MTEEKKLKEIEKHSPELAEKLRSLKKTISEASTELTKAIENAPASAPDDSSPAQDRINKRERARLITLFYNLLGRKYKREVAITILSDISGYTKSDIGKILRPKGVKNKTKQVVLVNK